MSNSIASNRSTLKEFLASIATIQGDLSNITAPPFVLGSFSTVELPQYWADHTSLFIAPALEEDAEKRAVLVLKWFLGSLRNQQYAGRREVDGVKKPLNAFLGELFLGHWKDDEVGETRLVAEQVSHHPPVTACYLANDKHGIRAEGFTQQEITFSGSVNIKQKGYAILHIDRYHEDYLIPVPNVKVKGILSGTLYPELVGTYHVISSSGFVSEVKFEGKGFFGGGDKNGFEARVYRSEAPSKTLYTASGQWNGNFSIQNTLSEEEVDSFNAGTAKSFPIIVADESEQDPWESRKAWARVIDALNRGDMKETSNAKSEVEEGQRQMRKHEEAHGDVWRRVFFQKQDEDVVFQNLVAADTEKSFTVDPKGGIWKADRNAIENAIRPYHGAILPNNKIPNGQNVHNGQSVNKDEGLEASGLLLETKQPLSASPGAAEATTVPRNGEVGMENESPEAFPSSNRHDIAEKVLDKTIIEEMLREKYSSAPRK